ncbi:alpha/beta hydrolase fold domain-containing protein [Pseudomonas aeruginosa]|uniref:alpha/beta hydrolase fold domain-containing protein n=1 Tax=Pseudomonas aeruginosa TaxID=287 RepID=UPI001C8E7B3B|nr:alpha/beta hydrolase fold domain-containing protein [Pseudomonas aeruginosa]MBY1010244.1 alpha/beta hydrolase fold domain-containing protein [Pseudomonas aeruginosa]
MRFRTLFLALCGLLLGHAATAAEPPAAPTPPTQPAEGPGGAAYRHASVHQWHFGEGAREYWVFTPEQPVPGNAPLVIFLHGWSVMQPDLYRAWIDHIVRRGMVVVYPRYQPDLKTPNADFLDNAAGALGDALRRLQAGELGVRPRLNQVAYLGHSAGGLLAANLAAASERLKLPAAKALMVVEPGKSQGKRWDGVPQERLSGLAKSTLLLAVCGDEDSHVACTDAKRIYRQSRHIPPSDKNLLLLRSDRHGAPPLLANHAAPTAPVFGPQYPKEEDSDWLLDRVEKRLEVQQAEGRYTGHDPLVIDALDWYGTWKLFDGLTDAAFYNRNRQYALGATPEQTGMGQWSDGTPVKPIKVLK